MYHLVKKKLNFSKKKIFLCPPFSTLCKVQAWYDEVKDWPAANVGSFSSVGATGVIGHYTQVIWAESKKVGCGVIYYRDQSDWAANYPYRKVRHLLRMNSSPNGRPNNSIF